MAARFIAGFQDYHADLARFPIRRTGDPARASDITRDAYVRIASCPEQVTIDRDDLRLFDVAPSAAPPEDVKGDTIKLVVPVEFFMR